MISCLFNNVYFYKTLNSLSVVIFIAKDLDASIHEFFFNRVQTTNYKYNKKKKRRIGSDKRTMCGADNVTSSGSAQIRKTLERDKWVDLISRTERRQCSRQIMAALLSLAAGSVLGSPLLFCSSRPAASGVSSRLIANCTGIIARGPARDYGARVTCTRLVFFFFFSRALYTLQARDDYLIC